MPNPNQTDQPAHPARAINAISLLRRHFEHHTHATATGALSHELAHVLAKLQEVTFDNTLWHPIPHPVSQLFPALPGNDATTNPLFAAFHPLLPTLPWRYGYTPRADAPGLENRMAWAELVGPAAPWQSNHVCLGLTAIAPNTRYPEHAHPAVEVYFVLSGHALWTANGITHLHPPGTFILHPSNTVHVMETQSEPLLAAYTWSGDVHSPSVYTETTPAK